MKCEICGKDILENSQCIDYKYYHNDCIENLQQENKLLKENYDRIYNENCKLREEHNITDISLLDENKKLKDNWNKLKEYIKETKLKEFEKSYGKRYGKTFTQAELIVCNMILDKMTEIEQESDK